MIGPGLDLVERERELRSIDTLLARAAEREGGALLIEGVAGIGKTTLVSAAAGRAEASGMRVLRARGGELERDVPFAIARELFLPALAAGSSWAGDDPLVDAAGLARPALGLSRAVAPGDNPTSTPEGRFAAIYGLYWLTVNLARGAPLLIVIDDLHAIDEESLRWIAYLAGRLEELAIALLLAGRPAQPGSVEPARGALAEVVGSPALSPAPLSPAAVGALVDARLGPPDQAFSLAVHDATGGVPFLVRAVLDTLADGGVEPVAASAARVAELGAPGIGRELLGRLGRVAPAAVAVAQAAAVLGPAADCRRVAALSALGPEDVSATADALRAAGFLQPGRLLQFAHPLVEEAVYRSVPEGRRSELHGRAGDLLARELEMADLAAAQLLSAQPRGDEARLGVLRSAARRALASGAPSTAAAYIRRGLLEPPPPAELALTLLELGRAEAQCDDPTALDHLSQAADLAPDGKQRALALRELVPALVQTGRFQEVLLVSRRALDSLGKDDRELRLEILAEMLAAAQMDALAPGEFEALLGEVDVERLGSSTPAERRMLAALSFNAMRTIQPADRALGLARRALGGGDRAEFVVMGSPALFLARIGLMYSGDLTLSRKLAVDASELAARHGAAGLYAHNMSILADATCHAGDLNEAEAAAGAAIEMAKAGSAAPLVVAMGVPILMLVQIARGDHERARATAGGLMDVPAEHVPLSYGLYVRGLLRLAEGDPGGALADLMACGRRCVSTGSLNPAQMPWRSLAATAHAALGDQHAALALAGEELALARRFGAPGPLGVALRAHGLLVGGEAGLDELREAAAVLSRSPARLEHGRALVELGAALRRAGTRRSARDALRSGLELAVRCDARGLVARAEDELRASGAHLVNRPRSGIDALTPSERRIAVLAADGLTNAQIAQSLFLSLKTVEMHLGRSYRKLGIATRAELAGKLAPGAVGADPTTTRTT